MHKSNNNTATALVAAGTLALCCGGMAHAAATADDAVAQSKGGFFSSFTQAFKFDAEHDVVRGHFDVGSEPDVHRFYCVVNEKNGEKRPNAISGETQLRKDGKTRLKAGAAVSTNSCESAESTGVLVTSGYLLTGIPDQPYKTSKPAASKPAAGASATPGALPAEGAPAASTSAAASAPTSAAAPSGGATPWSQPTSAPPATPSTSVPKSERVDVAGIRLGMSPDEVRGVLRGRKFSNYFESVNVVGSARSMNTIAAWNSPHASKDAADGEAYEITFTPLPAHERVVAIVHTVGYSAARAVPETALQEGLVNKYKGFRSSKDVPGAATWRYQRDGSVQVGDGCDRRGLFGGMGELSVAYPPRENIVLDSGREELQSQLERCGASIITEDHTLLGGSGAERLVDRFTVSAYSPAIAAEAAAGLRAAESGSSAAGVMRIGERPARDL